MKRPNINTILYLGLVGLLAACAESGQKSNDSETPTSDSRVLSGEIRLISGENQGFAEWTMVLIEEESMETRMSAIDRQGRFNFESVSLQSYYHLLLLDKSFQIISSLGDDYARVYVSRFKQFELSPIVYRGRIMQFLDRNTMEQKISESLDKNANGVVDFFDDDLNSNQVLDIFESDEAAQRPHSAYLQWHSFQLYRKADAFPQIRFKLEQRQNITDIEIVHGAESVFKGARALKGATSEPARWHGQLHDDGLSFDERANDGIWGQKLELISNTLPEAGQVFFYRFLYQGVLRYVPFMIPNVQLGKIEFELKDKNIKLLSDPFGSDIKQFPWSVHFYLPSQHVAFAAEIQEGRSYTIPDGVLKDGQDYSLRVVANSFAQKAGMPIYLIESEAVDYKHEL